MTTLKTDGPQATRHPLVGLAVLGLPTLLIALDNSVLYLALPMLSTDLRATSVQQLWITDMSVFTLAGLLVTAGALGDRIGRRRLLLIGSACLAVASVAAAWSVNAQMLIAARALMGAGQAALLPSIMGLIRIMFPDPGAHSRAIAAWMGCYVGGTALGPLAAGTLLESFWWGSVFVLNVPVVVAVLVLGIALLPEYKVPNAGRLHLPSAALSLAAVLLAVYGFKELSRDADVTIPLLSVAAGVLCGLVFALVQRAMTNPMLDLRLFRNRTLSAALCMTAVSGLMVGIQFFVALYLQVVEGLSPLRAAVWLLPSTLATVVSLQLIPPLARRVRPGHAIAGGLVVVAAGYLTLTAVDAAGERSLLMAGLVVSALGIGPLAALAAHLVLRSAPRERAGTAASMNETAGQLGIASGIAVLGMLGTAVYRGEMDSLPAGVPPEAGAAAQDSIIGAVMSAPQLPGDVAGALVAQANAALASGLAVTAAVCAAIAIAGAVLAAIALGHVPPTGRDEPEDEPAHTVPTLDKERSI